LLKRIARVTALASTGVLLTATAAIAHDTYVEDGAYDNAKATHGHDVHQHGGAEGHLEPTDPENDGLDLVTALELNRAEPGKIADVGVLGDHAYLAAWGGQTCKHNGVHVVNVSDVNNPTEVAFIPSKEGSYPGEGVQALTIDTPAFSGDILVTNNEKCKQPAGFGGMNIYDVSDPANWEKLAEGFGDAQGHNRKQSAHQTHSVFAWDAGSNAYAVMVDNEEAADVDIVDITNPRKPALVAEYDLAQMYPQILQRDAGLDEVFLHDMVVKEIDGRQVMLLSYWDAGYVQLDVTNPLTPVYLADSDFDAPDPEAAESGFTVPPEGNAHQAEFAGDNNRFVLGADEDFAPFALDATNVDDGTAINAGQGSDTTKLEPGQTITGEAVFFGRGCNGDANAGAAATDRDQIAVVERGLCTFTEKVRNVLAAGGYEAVLIFNRTGSDGCNGSLGMSVAGDIPTFGVAPRGEGFAIFDQNYDNAACLAGTGPEQASPTAVGTLGDTLTFSSYFDGWGYLRLLENENGKMTELDTHAVPEAHDPDFAVGFGDLSVHEVATSAQNPDVAFVSYYAAGLRVVDVSDGEIVEQAAFIDEGGNNFWGVEVFELGGQEYVAASDRDKGLYIFTYTAP
jgi:hypothetical protein